MLYRWVNSYRRFGGLSWLHGPSHRRIFALDYVTFGLKSLWFVEKVYSCIPVETSEDLILDQHRCENFRFITLMWIFRNDFVQGHVVVSLCAILWCAQCMDTALLQAHIWWDIFFVLRIISLSLYTEWSKSNLTLEATSDAWITLYILIPAFVLTSVTIFCPVNDRW